MKTVLMKIQLFLTISILSSFFSSGKAQVNKPFSLLSMEKIGAQAMPEQIDPIRNTPFVMPQLQRPTFKSDTIDIIKSGANPNEPITAIVNKAIDELSKKGGGTVVIPAGKWKSSRIVLKSNINLHLSDGCEIEFPGNAEAYLPAVLTRHEGIDIMGPGAFIYANRENNIAITGKGTIYGPSMDAEIRKRPNGPSVVENDIDINLPIEQRIYDGMEGRTFYRPKTITSIHCTNVFIEGITIERPVHWNICPIYCENIIIRGVTVNSVGIPSGDGIDIESCKNTLIEYCTLSSGDDCYTLKSGRAEDGIRVNKPTENVIIRYCLAKEGHGGITCGSETAGGIKNVYAHDCGFDSTVSVLRFKTRRNRGGGISDIYYERMRMINIREVATWDLLGTEMYMGELARRYPPRAIDRLTPTVKNISIKNFTADNATRFFSVNGIPEIPLSNVLIENGTINCKILSKGLLDFDGITIKNMTIHSEDNKLDIDEGRNLLFDHVKFTVPNDELIISVKGEKSGNIVFKDFDPALNNVEYKSESPLIFKVRDNKILFNENGTIIRIASYKNDKVCAISYTFDDGLAEHYTLLFPELEKREMKGTFFINGSKINPDENHITDTTRTTWNRLKEMSDKGHEIANHGWAHKNFGRFSTEEIKEDIYKNDSAIMANIGIRSTTFCYPNNNRSNPEAVKIALENRVGSRTFQRSIGSKSTPEDLTKWVNKLIETQDWGVGMTHGITYGYDAFGNPQRFWDHLDQVKALENKIWVGTFQEVAAYKKEWDYINCQLVATKKGFEIIPNLPLDKKIFTEPLTMVIENSNLQKIIIKQGNKKIPSQILSDKIIFDFNPYGDVIQINFK